MASGSSRAALLASTLLLLPGCWTSHLFEHGRTQESVFRYEAASLQGETLRIDYTAGPIQEIDAVHESGGSNEDDALAEPDGLRQRAALLTLSDLVADPEIPVDAFPVRRVKPHARTSSETPILLVEDSVASASTSRGSEGSARLVMAIEASEGRQIGFRLCPPSTPTCPAHFHSGALTRHRIDWWLYPAAPLALGVDIVLFPIQAVTLPVLLVFSD